MARITTITLENFKGISDPVEIPLRPITLLFGKNSAGKSTILHAILYARHILHTGKVDVDEIELGGDSINLGGFNNFVYKHDTKRSVRIRFEIDLEGIGLKTYNDDPTFDIFAQRFSSTENIYVEFIIRREAGKEISKECNIGIDNNLTVNIQWRDRAYYHLSEHDFFEEYPIENIEKLEFQSADPLPSIGHTLNFYGSEESEELFNYILNICIMRPLEILRNLIIPIRYIGPIRKIPPRNYVPHYTQNNERWASGLAAWDVLMNPNLKDSEKLLQDVNTALENLKLDYEVHKRHLIALELNDLKNIKRFRSLAKRLPDMNEDGLNEELKKIPILKGDIQVFLKEKNRNIEVALYDIGVGISQVVPVVIGALADDPNTNCRPSILAVEQPELHVHPAVQCELGDLFIQECKNQMFLIETHSEHLLLRILRRINDNYKNQADNSNFSEEDFILLYIERINDTMTVKSYTVDPDGQFEDPLPEDFFEERQKEWF